MGPHPRLADLGRSCGAFERLSGGRGNKAVSKAEATCKFAILPRQWTEEDGQLTPSLKLKRNVVMRESHDDVEALYRR